MFECQICGLLSLGGTACPACGSQLRKDLSLETEGAEALPNEVPGLDDAAAAWYDLEGIEPPAEDEAAEEAVDVEQEGSLPFGFQGSSNVYDSRLPFGIGSFAEGIPFEGTMAEVASQPSVTAPTAPPPKPELEPEPEPVSEPIVQHNAAAPGTTDVSEVEPVIAREPPADIAMAGLAEDQEPPTVPDLPVVNAEPALTSTPPPPPGPMPSTPPPAPSTSLDTPLPPPGPMPATPPPAPHPFESAGPDAPVRLTTARLVDDAPFQDEPPVPDYWRIDAPIPDYEQIYGEDSAVVEVDFTSLEDDVVVYDHTTDSPAAVFHSPLEASPTSAVSRSISLRLHPAQALSVDVGASAELQALVSQGFMAMQSGDWSGAARSFQRMAASMPGSAEVFNNYGISLLQRAVSMRDGGDQQQRSMAETQFESAILALREAAKSAPSNGDVLVNLGIALIESGRAEKALGIMNVHNAREPGSAKGLNTAGVAMFHLGQLTQAVETFGQAGVDAVASENLAQLAPKQG
jgi:Tfp pilus assembly protein PilF